MAKRRRFPRIYFGWWTVLAGGILSLWGHGYYSYGISSLFIPISSELGFSRATTSVAASIGKFEGGFESPLAGWITDRFGPKWIIFVGTSFIGLSLTLMYFINSLWSYYLVWGLMLGTGVNITLSVPLQTAITNWFVKKRGLASSIQLLFSGLSGVLVLPLIAWLITIRDWRMTCLIGGLVMLVVGLPLVWRCFRQYRPEYYGLLPDGSTTEEEAADASQMIERGVAYAAEVEEIEFTLRQALRTPAYWLLIVTNACHALSGPSLYIHVVPFLTDLGMDEVKAAATLSMLVLASIPARLVGGMLADRVKRNHLRFLMTAAYSLEAIGFALYLLNQTMPMIYVWFIIYGIGSGAGMGLMFPMRARYFGRKAYGSIQGIASLAMVPAGIAAPIYLGWVFDTHGSYIQGFTLVAGLVAFAAVLSPFIIPPKPPAIVTDIRDIV